tara:strand:- start:835 stop:1056 length:222 start_codon:yes stop_codon:yes gene_type:complete
MHLKTYLNIHERASDKAYARIIMAHNEVENNKTELKSGSYGGITEEEMIMVLEGNKIELKIWQYIAKIIEKNE